MRWLVRILSDAAHVEKLAPGGSQDGGCLAKNLEQLAHPDRSDIGNQVQGHQGFTRVHA